jgi:thiol-disulfide isomerase/thioredoxin
MNYVIIVKATLFQKVLRHFVWGFFFLFLLNSTSFAAPIASRLVDLSGNPVVLDPKKPKALLVFWATWCPDCRDKMSGELVELSKRSDVEVVAINTESDPKKVKAFSDAEKIQLSILRDPEKELRKSLKVVSVPHWAAYKKSADGSWILVDSAPAYETARVQQALEIKK